ncbi:MAG: helix-turn-helix transcriptional regulator [Lachnospiraceae bacterium]|nr:helix-turn-helix transcriptional regulator [Lachnospiraceae bacterium]
MEKTIGMRIRECRLALGMTQEELAEQICCKKSLISQYENDKVDIKGSVIVELAEFLGTTTGYLLNDEIGCDLDEEEMEMIKLMKLLNKPVLKKIALEQVKLLSIISEK